MLNLEEIAGTTLDLVGDGVAVGRTEDQGLEDEHVERAR
jgi:hypothetical protein